MCLCRSQVPDELAGRDVKRLEKVGIYNDEKIRLAEVAEELLVCSELSRDEGLLALDERMKGYEGESKFLPFASPISHLANPFSK